jgi:hypothetical protein
MYFNSIIRGWATLSSARVGETVRILAEGEIGEPRGG